MTGSIYESEARERKANAIADALDGAEVLPVDACVFTPAQRRLVTDAAGQKPASAETWALACTKLAVRYDLRARLAGTDPFADLPS